MEEIDIFLKRLHSLILDRGITQSELCRKIGVTKATLSRYISFKRLPATKHLIKIAKALNTTPNYLLGFDE